MQRFVILSAKRSGSNLLCTLLDSHPEVLCHHELFNPRGIFVAKRLRDGALNLGSIEERDADPIGFLNRAWYAGPAAGCVGFKWTQDRNRVVFDHVLGDPSVKKVVLRRANRIKRYVSEKIAETLDQWEAYQGDELSPRPRVAVDVAAMLDHIAASERLYDELSGALGADSDVVIQVEYESLFDAADQSRLLGFLGVRDQGRPLTATSIKQNPTDLRDLISNFGELSDRLRGTEFYVELHARGM